MNPSYASPPCGRLEQLLESALRSRLDQQVVIGSEGGVTGGQLLNRVGRLAARLRDAGASANQCVGLCVRHSPQLVVGVLGILASGAACVPLDPSHPKQRLQELARRVRAVAVVGGGGVEWPCPWLPVDARRDCASLEPADPGNVDDLAFVFFTSGSTGEPKGVMQTHRQVCEGQLGPLHFFGFEAGERMLLRTPISMSTLACEILWPLLTCGTVVVCDWQQRNDPMQLLGLIRQQQVHTLVLVPSLLRALLDQGLAATDPIRRIVCAGEPLAPSLEARVQSTLPGRLNIIYGTTEAPSSTVMAAQPGRASGSKVGWPVVSKRIYILDALGQPVGPGQQGEIFVGGGIAQGYWGAPPGGPFGPDPFSPLAGARMYRTGDLGCFLADGCVQLSGRADEQIKVRGHRVEPAEIESRLCAFAGLLDCAVGQVQVEGRQLLLAWVSPAALADKVSELRAFLSEQLPTPMLPNAYVALAEIPRTPAGKVDRRALPLPSPEKVVGPKPQPQFQRDGLGTIWREILGRPEASEDDDFFALGGDSLLAARLMQRIASQLGAVLPVSCLLEQPTLKGLRQAWEKASLDNPLLALDQTGPGQPLYCLHGLGGELFPFRLLAPLLKRPVYGFRALPGESETVEAMAGRYMQALLDFQPQGPYHVVAFSAGCPIAYELARLLVERQHTVGLLAFIDYPAPGPHFWDMRGLFQRRNFLCLLASLPWRLHDFWRGGWRQSLTFMRDLACLLATRPQAPRSIQREITRFADGLPGRHSQVANGIFRAIAAYRPVPAALAILVLGSRQLPLLSSHDPELGWGQLALRGVEAHQAAVNHGAILRAGNVEQVAQLLESHLS